MNYYRSTPYTQNQFKVLYSAFYGCAHQAAILQRRAKTRAINEMVSAGLVYGGFEGGALTPAGLRAYVDMCERLDASSGCVAWQKRAEEARRKAARHLPGKDGR